MSMSVPLGMEGATTSVSIPEVPIAVYAMQDIPSRMME